ncbi:MAG: AAA family ATPase [Desulfosarcinaceae bacterium]
MQTLSYLNRFSLDRHPFPVAPDDENFFLSGHIEQVLVEIVHGVTARKGFMVLVGDVGLGKTTLVRRILKILDQEKVCTSFVFHTALKDVDLLREINRDFGLAHSGAGEGQDNFGDQLKRLNDFLLSCYRRGHNCAIVIDDAQNLDHGSLELVRMISNLETDQQKLVQIILVGQTELLSALECPDLRQLKSRVVILKHARPLKAGELRDYIMFKLNLAGSQGRISVTGSAFARLFRVTKGNFRLLNMIMDRCLYVICHKNTTRIDKQTVALAQADLRPRPARLRKRPLALAASLLLPVLLAAGAWSMHFSTSRAVSAAVSPEMEYHKIDDHAAEPGVAGKPDAQADPVRSTPAPTSGIDGNITEFLKVHGLEAYSEDFSRALAQGTLPLLADRIYRQEGLQLVQLNLLSAPARRRYGALVLPGRDGEASQWLVFWEPALQLKRFYYHYRGAEIINLQKLLAAMRLYTDKIDGIVGTRLMKAVIAFQEQNRLPVTGFPDSQTIFLLCQQQEDVALWPKHRRKNPSANS